MINEHRSIPNGGMSIFGMQVGDIGRGKVIFVDIQIDCVVEAFS